MKYTAKALSKWTYLFSIAILASACNDYEVPESPEDIRLLQVLAEKSPTGTIEGLLLPSSYNYTKLPQDPKNPLTKEKIELGKLLFHETALAINPKNTISMNTYSCASCHHAGAGFQSGMRQGMGDGGDGFGYRGEGRTKNVDCPTDSVDVQPLKSPSVLNIAYQPNILWNGQFGATYMNVGTETQWTMGTPLAVNMLGYEGVETQAIAGFKVHRMGVNRSLLTQYPYSTYIKKAFKLSGELVDYTDDELIEMIGLAIAAYERTVVADLSPYQQYISGNASSLSSDEKEGMELFFTKAECYKCHNGPALSSMEFHALGFEDLSGADIIDLNDANAARGRGGFTKNSKDDFKFKVPQLYNLKEAAFYGHGSSFTTIEDVVNYKNSGVAINSKVPITQLASEFKPLNLTKDEVDKLVAFIENGLSDPELHRYSPAFLPSGNCFPNNDSLSKSQICE